MTTLGMVIAGTVISVMVVIYCCCSSIVYFLMTEFLTCSKWILRLMLLLMALIPFLLGFLARGLLNG